MITPIAVPPRRLRCCLRLPDRSGWPRHALLGEVQQERAGNILILEHLRRKIVSARVLCNRSTDTTRNRVLRGKSKISSRLTIFAAGNIDIQVKGIVDPG